MKKEYKKMVAALSQEDIAAFESRLGLEDGTAAPPVKFLDRLRDDQEEREMMGLPITFRPLTAGFNPDQSLMECELVDAPARPIATPDWSISHPARALEGRPSTNSHGSVRSRSGVLPLSRPATSPAGPSPKKWESWKGRLTPEMSPHSLHKRKGWSKTVRAYEKRAASAAASPLSRGMTNCCSGQAAGINHAHSSSGPMHGEGTTQPDRPGFGRSFSGLLVLNEAGYGSDHGAVKEYTKMHSRNKYTASQPPVWVENTTVAQEVQAITKDVRLACSPKSARGESFKSIRFEYYDADHEHNHHSPAAALCDTKKNFDFESDFNQDDGHAADETTDTHRELVDGEPGNDQPVGKSVDRESDHPDEGSIVQQPGNPSLKLSMPRAVNQKESRPLTSPSGGRRVKRVVITTKRPVDWPRYVPSKQVVEKKRSEKAAEMAQLLHERDIEISKRSQEVLLSGVGQVASASRLSLQSRREERLQSALYRGEQWAINEADRCVEAGPEI